MLITDKATRFGYKKIAIVRAELQDTKRGLITTVITLDSSTSTIKMYIYVYGKNL
jgi:hypothetical protein